MGEAPGAAVGAFTNLSSATDPARGTRVSQKFWLQLRSQSRRYGKGSATTLDHDVVGVYRLVPSTVKSAYGFEDHGVGAHSADMKIRKNRDQAGAVMRCDG